MNKVILMGRLTRDPEVRYTQTGKVVCQFTLAVDRYGAKEGEQSADFVPVVVWGKVGEACGNNLAKGKLALVDGRLQIRSYEAKDGSGKRWVTEVIAGSVQFLDRKTNIAGAHEQSAADGNMESFGSATTFDEEIPF